MTLNFDKVTCIQGDQLYMAVCYLVPDTVSCLGERSLYFSQLSPPKKENFVHTPKKAFFLGGRWSNIPFKH